MWKALIYLTSVSSETFAAVFVAPAQPEEKEKAIEKVQDCSVDPFSTVLEGV